MRFPIGLSASLTYYIVKNRLSKERFAPLVLMLEPLFACNLNCTTCGRIHEYSGHLSEMMSLEDCINAANECPAPIVTVCGGEPLIYPHIVDLTEELIKMGKYVYLCTNGIMLSKAVDEFKPSSKFLFNVHIDGPAEVHDLVVSKHGAYETALKGIILAARSGFQVTVNTTVYKQTDLHQIDALMDKLSRLGVRCFMLSPAYSYEAADSQDCFMSRADTHEKFQNIDHIAQRHRLADSPIYLEYLKGERELQCTAWGNPTRNVMGWRSPCYLLADSHYPTYNAMIENTDWDSYGTGKDPRCEDCMVHCGFEPSVALMVNKLPGDIWKMIKWQFG